MFTALIEENKRFDLKRSKMEASLEQTSGTWVRCLKELAVSKSFVLLTPSPPHPLWKGGWQVCWSSISGKIQKVLLGWKNARRKASENIKHNNSFHTFNQFCKWHELCKILFSSALTVVLLYNSVPKALKKQFQHFSFTCSSSHYLCPVQIKISVPKVLSPLHL